MGLDSRYLATIFWSMFLEKWMAKVLTFIYFPTRPIRPGLYQYHWPDFLSKCCTQWDLQNKRLESSNRMVISPISHRGKFMRDQISEGNESCTTKQYRDHISVGCMLTQRTTKSTITQYTLIQRQPEIQQHGLLCISKNINVLLGKLRYLFKFS